MDALTKFIDETWSFFHSHPELGHQEYETAAYIAEHLREYGYQVEENVGTTGVIGRWDTGVEGPVFGLRADMDALKFHVDGEEKLYHGCGHDAHCTILLTVAKLLKEQDIVKKGQLVLLFQPAEEPCTGAYSVIDSGKISDVQELVGLHVRNRGEGKTGNMAALYNQGLGVLTVTIHGQRSHASRPHQGINAVEAAVLSINAVNSLKFNPRVSHSMKVTRFWADGSGENTISDMANFAFDLRSENNEVLLQMCEAAKKAVNCTCEILGATCEFQWIMNPASSYDPELIEYCKQAVAAELGSVEPDLYSPGGEDFHCYTTAGIKTAFMALMAEMDPGLHVYGCTFDHDCLEVGVRVMTRIVKGKLG